MAVVIIVVAAKVVVVVVVVSVKLLLLVGLRVAMIKSLVARVGFLANQSEDLVGFGCILDDVWRDLGVTRMAATLERCL